MANTRLVIVATNDWYHLGEAWSKDRTRFANLRLVQRDAERSGDGAADGRMRSS